MALRLEIISRHRQGLGERGSMEFGQAGGTIGRSLESDWVLPDGQRYLSSRHASIDYRSGSYYIVDTSTNGVFVNDAEQPVGRGNPQRLFTGDRIRIGEFEMSVEIAEVDDTNAQLTGKHVDPVSRAQRVPPPDPTRADLVAPHEITAVGIEMMLSDEAEIGAIQRLTKANAANLRLEPDPPPPQHEAATAQRPAPHAEPAAAPSPPQARRVEPPAVSAAARVLPATPPQPPKQTQPPPRAASPPAPAPARGASTAPAQRPAPAVPNLPLAGAPGSPLEAFFRGAGLPTLKVDEKQAEQVLHRLGQLMREVVLGISDNLHLRAEQKNALRVPTTTIQPQNNNPLKFSASVEETLHNLLFRDSGEYLSAVDAVRETFGDIKHHQQHLLAALRKGIVDYVGRLDPDELESKVGSGRVGALLNATNKLKYWDIYKDLYQVVTHHQPGQFPQQFLEELARAYEHEVARTAPAGSAGGRQSKLG
jgi:type VI secretion system protein